MDVCYECFVLSGRGFYDGLITRPEESYLVCVSESDREASIIWRPWPSGGLLNHKNILQKIFTVFFTVFLFHHHLCSIFHLRVKS